MTEQVNLLIVDDDEALCQTLADILQEIGYSAEIVLTGKEALRKSAAKYFNVALIDIRLPDIDGLELLVVLRGMNPELEGIIITGYSSLETAVEALRLGVSDYVLKPLKMEEVLASVREAVKKQKLTSQERQRLEREIEAKDFYRSLSIIDELTGLYNYRHFQELLIQELRRAKRYSHPLSLLLIDIDKFKEYQDAHGHLAGDAALKDIAQVTRSMVRGADVVARYGGEEFAIIMPETSKEGAAIAAERARRAVAETTLSTGDRLTVSIGVATYPTDAQDKEQLVSRADQALYRAKREGRNMACVWE